MQSLEDARLATAKNCEMASSQIVSDEAFLFCINPFIASRFKCKFICLQRD